MAGAASLAIERIIGEAVQSRGAALLALPGGSTPDELYERIAVVRSIDWKKVTMLPLDERLLPPGHPEATLTKLRAFFGGTGASIVALADEAPPSDAASAGLKAERRVSGLSWPLDLACLGIGADGHAASIFPGPDLEAALFGSPRRRAIGVRPEPRSKEAAVERVTLTGSTITAARHKLLLLKGDQKRQVLERAVADGLRSEAPVGRLLAASAAPFAAYWCPR